MEEGTINFLDHFNDLKDPRIERTKLHGMFEIIFLTLCGIISDCEGWIEIEDYGKAHINFLRKYLPYKNGIPSDDTLRRFFRAIDAEQLSRCFNSWIKSIVKPNDLNGKVIAIDGKTSRGSGDDSHKALHMVSAYATDLRLILCQQKVADKSNEITAIPQLLKVLDLRGAIITIDAMGTQKAIAAQIQDQHGDYVLALKRNQGDLYEEVDTFFTMEKEKGFKGISHDSCVTFEKGHGRIEKRKCTVSNALQYISKKIDWKGIKSIACIESAREIKGKVTEEKRYYITSLDASAEKILHIIRSHWGIENSVFWVLDMSFGDDQSRIRKENSPANIAIIRHFALNFLNNAKPLFGRTSIRRLRRMAGWQAAIIDMIFSAYF